MFDRLRQIVRSTPRDSRHRGRRRGEGRGETVGATRGGTMGRAREGTIGQNREQASRVGHIGQHEYQYRGPAPPNSHNQSISSPGRSWNIFRSRHTRYEDPTPPLHYSPSTSRHSSPPSYFSPPPYGTPYETSSPLFEHGRRSTSSRSGSVGLVPGSQHNIATVRHADAGSRRQTAASRLSGSYPPSYRSTDDTSFHSYTSREALLSPHTSRERRTHSSRTSARRQSHRSSYGSPERPHTSSSRAGGSGYSS